MIPKAERKMVIVITFDYGSYKRLSIYDLSADTKVCITLTFPCTVFTGLLDGLVLPFVLLELTSCLLFTRPLLTLIVGLATRVVVVGDEPVLPCTSLLFLIRAVVVLEVLLVGVVTPPFLLVANFLGELRDGVVDDCVDLPFSPDPLHFAMEVFVVLETAEVVLVFDVLDDALARSVVLVVGVVLLPVLVPLSLFCHDRGLVRLDLGDGESDRSLLPSPELDRDDSLIETGELLEVFMPGLIRGDLTGD